MKIYRHYESKRTDHKPIKPIRKPIKVAIYTIRIPKSLKFCYASEITTFKYSRLIPPINKYFLSEQQKKLLWKKYPTHNSKKNCFQKSPVNKIKKKCTRSILGKITESHKRNLNKSHTMMMNLRMNIKKYPTLQRID